MKNFESKLLFALGAGSIILGGLSAIIDGPNALLYGLFGVVILQLQAIKNEVTDG